MMKKNKNKTTKKKTPTKFQNPVSCQFLYSHPISSILLGCRSMDKAHFAYCHSLCLCPKLVSETY